VGGSAGTRRAAQGAAAALHLSAPIARRDKGGGLQLRAHGRADLAELVRHVAVVEGNGTGYDVASFELDGSDRFIEVKTTRSGVQTDFFVSANEVQFSIQQRTSYYLYRVYDFDPSVRRGQYYVRRGSLVDDVSLQLQPVQFRVRLASRTE
jgi:uncharacterized membrane protein